MDKCNVKALTLSLGIVWGVYVLFIGWAGALGWGARLASPISSLYIGFAPTFVGGIIGGIWGFVDGAIGGALIAWLYNMFAKTKKKK